MLRKNIKRKNVTYANIRSSDIKDVDLKKWTWPNLGVFRPLLPPLAMGLLLRSRTRRRLYDYQP